jgi:4-amino-4-deoxy-L-arabinose transferase-like glycosyltransferase
VTRIPPWALVLIAAALRFPGLAWGLRHPPVLDERVFVENAWAMLAQGSLDHRFYEYPGLFFFVLLPGLALGFRDGTSPGPGAYLAARATVAALGVLGVWLAYRVTRRLVGPWAAVAAGLVLAVSPLAVRTAHMVRPDVALAVPVLLALDAIVRDAPARAAGAAMGAAMALKFTGMALWPAYVARLFTADRARGAPVVLAVSLLVFLAFAWPLAVRPHDFLAGVADQQRFHHEPSTDVWTHVKVAAFYARSTVAGLGPVAAGLAVAGIWLTRTQWREWWPLILYPLALVAVLSTAWIGYERHLLPALPVGLLFAGHAVEAVARRSRAGAWTLVALAGLWPAVASVRYVVSVCRPAGYDLALDWIDANARPGARVFLAEDRLGLDVSRYAVWRPSGSPDVDRARILQADLVATRPDDPRAAGLTRVFEAELDDPPTWRPLALFTVPAHLRATVP